MLIVNLNLNQNLRQENGMLSMIKTTQTMVKEMKVVQMLKLKSLNQIFVVIQTHIFLGVLPFRRSCFI